MGDEDEFNVQGYLSLDGEEPEPADIVMWNMTGEEIIRRLALEMVFENRYQMCIRYAGGEDE